MSERYISNTKENLYFSFQVMAVALFAWREACGGGPELARAFCSVVRNRVRSEESDVVTVTAGRAVSPLKSKWPSIQDNEFLNILEIASTVLRSTNPPDPTNGALFYENANAPSPKGISKNVREKMRVTATIGEYVFYGP